MNPIRARLFLAATVATLAMSAPASAALVLPRPSPNAEVKQTVGVTDLSVKYSRPGVKGREIWGGLVPYDKVWRTGANDPTTLVTSTDITLGGRKLAAGTYKLLTLPTASDWTVIVTTQDNLNGSFNYDSTTDVMRVTAKPEMDQPFEEWMWLGFEDLTPSSANLTLRWEKLKLTVPITVATNDLALANCRAEVASAAADDWRTRFSAARWCFDNEFALDEGSGWLDQSLAAEKNHTNLNLKARWLWKDGKSKEAVAAAKDAIAAGKASKETVDVSGTEKLLAEWTAKPKKK